MNAYPRASIRLVLASFFLALGSFAFPACSSDDPPASPAENTGGTAGDPGLDAGLEAEAAGGNCPFGVTEAGTCAPKCDISKCNPGNICVNETCKLQCVGHLDCPSGYECTPAVNDADGSETATCEPSKFPVGEGEFFWPCPMGDECNTDAGYLCLGSGPADADAYCSKYDCKSDEECPGGTYCGAIRQFNPVCDKPEFGEELVDNTLPCINSADYEADGKTFREGPMTLLRNICLRRGYCADCQSDLDCSLLQGNGCMKLDPNAAGYCTRTCDPAKRGACIWEGASTCAPAQEGAEATCSPTYGACVGDGSACSPCRNDEDCWDGTGARKLCLRSMNSLEPFCVDLDTPCTSNTDCPTPAGGRRMQCLNSSDYVGSILYQRCYPANQYASSSNPGHPSCYPPP